MKWSGAPCVEELSSAVPRAVEPWSVTAPVGEITGGGDGPWLSVLQTHWFTPAAFSFAWKQYLSKKVWCAGSGDSKDGLLLTAVRRS